MTIGHTESKQTGANVSKINQSDPSLHSYVIFKSLVFHFTYLCCNYQSNAFTNVESEGRPIQVLICMCTMFVVCYSVLENQVVLYTCISLSHWRALGTNL